MTRASALIVYVPSEALQRINSRLPVEQLLDSASAVGQQVDRFLLAQADDMEELTAMGICRRFADFALLTVGDDLPDVPLWDAAFRDEIKTHPELRGYQQFLLVVGTLPYLSFDKLGAAIEMLPRVDEVRMYVKASHVCAEGKVFGGTSQGELVPGFAAWRTGVAGIPKIGYCSVPRTAALDVRDDECRDFVEAIDYVHC